MDILVDSLYGIPYGGLFVFKVDGSVIIYVSVIGGRAFVGEVLYALGAVGEAHEHLYAQVILGRGGVALAGCAAVRRHGVAERPERLVVVFGHFRHSLEVLEVVGLEEYLSGVVVLAHGIVVERHGAGAYLAHELLHVVLVRCGADGSHRGAYVEQIAVEHVLVVILLDAEQLLAHVGEVAEMRLVEYEISGQTRSVLVFGGEFGIVVHSGFYDHP